MRYLIWSPGRTGSIFASKLLKNYISEETGDFGIYHMKFAEDSFDEIDRFPVIHTHELDLFYELLYKENMKSIVITRNIFDVVLSTMISVRTTSYTISSPIEVAEYRIKNKNTKILIDEDKFKLRCKLVDVEYTNAINFCSKLNTLIIDYKDYIKNPKVLCEKLGIIPTINMFNDLPKQTPINKSEMLLNFNKLTQIYENLNLRNNF